jgi:uncharacterized protein YbcV (DUF1398 family)
MPAIKKSWPRIRPTKNGAGIESWEVDLRPHGKRKYYPTKQEAEDAAHMARVQRERGNVVLVRVLKKSWPRVRASKNGAGVESWVVDLRPHGKRKYYPSRQEAESAAHVARAQRERGKGLVTSAVFSKRQILDAQAAFNLLKDTNVTLTEAVGDYLDRHHSSEALSQNS